MPLFKRYIGIDYSGADIATKALTGLRVFVANAGEEPAERLSVHPGRDRWDRQTLAFWLRDKLRPGADTTVVGIDHAFSLTREWFDHFQLHTWDDLLAQMSALWPPDVRVADSECGQEAEAEQQQWERWRLTDQWVAGAKSVFDQQLRQGTVYKSTRAGIPWLHWLRGELGGAVHFWPFDGWAPRTGQSVIAEVYPSIFRRRFTCHFPTTHQRDACAVTSWLHDRDRHDLLAGYFQPPLSEEERELAHLEGWMLGVG